MYTYLHKRKQNLIHIYMCACVHVGVRARLRAHARVCRYDTWMLH